GAVERLLDLRLGYSEATGTLRLRSLLAQTYEDCGPDNILVTTGAIEANFLLFNVLLSPGDHVVAPYPAYQQLYSVPRALGCDVSLWRVSDDNGFRFDLEGLERLLRPETRLVVINSPHNPTGAMLTPGEFQQVYDLADSVGARVLSDEAYRWLAVPGGFESPPPMYNLGPAGISVGTFSKPFGLPGLRIGWMAAPAEITAECWAMRDYVSLSPGKLNDALAVLALEHREQIVQRNAAIIGANLATANRWVAEHADILSWTPPLGGLLALLRYNLDIASLDLANKLAEEHSVMLAPGSAFGFEHHLRIGIGQEPSVFAAGLERASACFASLQADGLGPIQAQ
ncbi:MAG: aminotransferase class I/II-fold pyridoxal phosphate-dependent enzyme, partial [Anaerolineae bacterium]|nr:aminotransferase class I/II-fold pyridoxal phosphate-dependent enzyme [Anaerolineae bacterium]